MGFNSTFKGLIISDVNLVVGEVRLIFPSHSQAYKLAGLVFYKISLRNIEHFSSLAVFLPLLDCSNSITLDMRRSGNLRFVSPCIVIQFK